jgi:PAS domain S-box-containing protein
MSTPLRVLIVEDSEDDAILVLRELRRGGYDTTHERVDTAEAMKAALEEQEWDIVLSDYSMPHFSMPAALATVKEKGLDLPFIIVSGAIGEEAAVNAMREGARDYVMKNNLARLVPVVERELRETEARRDHERMQQALKDSEELYSALIGNLTDAVFLIRGGEIAWCNDRAEEIYGYPMTELLGKEISFFYPSETQVSKHRNEVSSSIQKDGLYRGTSEFQKKDGDIIYLEYSLSQIPGKKPVELIAVARDITERKQAEDTLRHSEEYYRALIENAQDVIIILNSDSSIRYESPSFKRVLGFTSTKQVGINPFQLIHPDDIEEAAKSLKKLMSHPEATIQSEIRVQNKEGTWLTLEIVGKNLMDNPAVNGIVANFRDITERKLAEEALKESEASLRAMIENAPDSIAVYDLNGTILETNKRSEEMIGLPREEIIGKNMFDVGVIPQDYVPRTKKSLEHEGENVEVQPFEFDLMRKDGSRITVEATTIAKKRAGKVEIICITRDITERKRAEEEKRRLEQQLQLAGRLAAVGELAAGVAHELNNPLAAIQAFAEFLTDRDEVDEVIKSDVETIYKEAQRATRITANLLRFARRNKPEKQFISINEIIERSMDLHAYRMKVNNIQVLLELDPELPMTMADPDQMHQVFVNLTTNAEQAMTESHSGGRLLVKTQLEGKKIHITFTDSGPGISENDLKSIFDPFFTTKEVGKGTGLGLSICYGIIHEHGGNMYARNNTDTGVTFVMEIPVLSEEQSVPEQCGMVENH